jgi:hypothetical protein
MAAGRGTVQFNIERGAGLREFHGFLSDFENAYLSIYLLPTRRGLRHLERRLHFPLEYFGFDFIAMRHHEMAYVDPSWIHPKDQLEITRITIQSAGWIELLGSLNPLQQIREYLKDRHERKKDKEWRWETEKQRALAELEILRIQAERERLGAISEFNELLERMDISPEQRQKILWERIGVPLMRLARHQDTGLLGSQNPNIDGKR